MSVLSDFLKASHARHTHLCPRQVLGVRIALAGLRQLDLSLAPKRRKNLLVIAETDGCFVDGIEVAAWVSVGHRSLKIRDYGKIAATFIDLRTGQAIRFHPALRIRERARKYFPEEKRAYFAQLLAYQIMPDCELLTSEAVTLAQDLRQITGSSKQRTYCVQCGEEIINGREIMEGESAFCMACMGNAYYLPGEIGGTIDTQVAPTPAALPQG